MRRTAPRAVAVPSPQRARPHRIAALAVLAASTALLAAVGSAHADIAPTLSAELATAVPGKDLTVIVSLAAQVDPAAYANDPTGLVAAEHALAEQTQPAVVAAAGVPAIDSLWSINAVVLAAPPATIERLAAMPEVARVDLDPTARIAPVSTETTPVGGAVPARESTARIASTAPATPRRIIVIGSGAPLAQLRITSIVQHGAGASRRIVVRVGVARAAGVRAELLAAGRTLARASARRARAGALRIVLRPPAGASGRVLIRVRATASRRVGPAVERAAMLTA